MPLVTINAFQQILTMEYLSGLQIQSVRPFPHLTPTPHFFNLSTYAWYQGKKKKYFSSYRHEGGKPLLHLKPDTCTYKYIKAAFASNEILSGKKTKLLPEHSYVLFLKHHHCKSSAISNSAAIAYTENYKEFISSGPVKIDRACQFQCQ